MTPSPRAPLPPTPIGLAASRPIAITDLLHREASARQTFHATCVAGVLVLLSVASVGFESAPGPVLPPFIPISATLWGVADMLTAFLLFTQYSVNGIRAFAFLGAAYAIPAMLTIPYIVYFPSLFFMPPLTVGLQQISAWLWIAWHVAFAAIVGGYHLVDHGLNSRAGSGAAVNRLLVRTLAACVTFAAVTIACAVLFQDRLPVVVSAGRFSTLYVTAAAPFIVCVNVTAAAIILIVAKRRSTLQLWLIVALLTAALDGALNAWAIGRYTVTWYAGKIETLCTATVVLMILLAEINALYRRLGGLATIDALTGLPNRQSFDNDAKWALGLRQRAPIDLAYIVVDIDYFKQYNDLYGHQGGDECLRRVADSLRRTCGRASDLVGRFGGEEFVVLLTGANVSDASRIAETIRSDIEALAIAHGGSQVAAVVTVSVGVVHACAEQADVRLETLFARADAALYASKVTRNMVTVV
jgi:diguanylate cyclase (GGDEF)-like protein